MRVRNYMPLYLYTIIFVVVVVCSQSSVKHLVIDRLEPKSSSSMSRYMINLYQKYKDGEISEENKTTVRSILPMKGKLESREMLVYNMSNVPASDEILKAELHIHLRARNSKPQIYSLQLWNLMGTSFAPLEEISTNGGDVGWMTFDTTNTVLECIQSNDEGQHLLGVSMEGDNGRGLVHPLLIKRMFASNIQPFLVLFSNPIERNNTTDDDEELISEIITETLKSDFLKSQRQHRRRKRHHKIHNIFQAMRKKEGRNEYRRVTKYQNYCEKRELVLNVTDLGWESFVIAPDGIEINYCEGKCKYFPPSKGIWTNHAILQLLHHLRMYSRFPPPCCSPHKLSSVSLMEIGDAEGELILKNIRNAKVEKCKCL